MTGSMRTRPHGPEERSAGPPRRTLVIAAVIVLAVVACGSLLLARTRSAADGRNAAALGQPASGETGGALLRIDPGSNRVSKRTPLSGANMVAAGLGSVWVTGTVANQKALIRISPVSAEVLEEVALEPFRVLIPGDLALGEGAAWVLGGEAVYRLEAASGRLTTIPIGDTGVLRSGIAAGGGGVWVSTSDRGTVDRLHPRGRSAQRVRLGSFAGGLSFGDGSIWVTSEREGLLTRIDPVRHRVAESYRVPGATGAAVLGARAAWVVSSATGTVARVEPDSGQVTAVAVGRRATGVGFGHGSVWVLNGGDGTVSRVDPATLRVTATISVGPRPYALAVDETAVWVTVLGTGGHSH